MATPFEKLAKKRKVDLPAERKRAERQHAENRPISPVPIITPKRESKEFSQSEARRRRIAAEKEALTKPPKFGTAKATTTTTTTTGQAGASVKFGLISPEERAKRLKLGLSILPLGSTMSIAAIGKRATALKLGSDIVREPGTRTAVNVAKNTKTLKLTESWLTKIAAAAKNPAVVVSVLLTAIGSYPFAGFIKEEALQTLSFAVKSAIANNDVEGAELALEEQKDILNPDIVDKIISAIPVANVVKELADFFDAARTKVKIDEKVVVDMKIQIETGETEDEKWKRIKQEEVDQEKETTDYYNEQRKLQVTWENESRAAARTAQSREERKARNQDAAFWAAERAKQRELEAEDRKAIADFWMEYRRRIQEIQEDNRPSNLNFGLI